MDVELIVMLCHAEMHILFIEHKNDELIKFTFFISNSDYFSCGSMHLYSKLSTVGLLNFVCWGLRSFPTGYALLSLCPTQQRTSFGVVYCPKIYFHAMHTPRIQWLWSDQMPINNIY